MSYALLIGVDDLRVNLRRGRWAVFDCRFDLKAPEAGQQAYAAGHVPGARYADLARDLSGAVASDTGRHPLPDTRELGLFLSRCGVTSETQVVAYDDHGGAYAARLWWLLRWLGHERVAVLDGGLAAWRAAGLALSTDRSRPTAGKASSFGAAHDSCWLDTAALSDALARRSVCLLDAREPERYRGEIEPIDPVAGHIPGARSVPYRGNLDANGRFLDARALRERFAAELAGQAPEQVVHMCGSGVTACQNILAMEVAGLSGSKLYPGSWSAWISDPQRPVARGPD
ncbi:MAG: 3-mercaptopyruvate sulfurtransferase [Gammaproteobacteria bacterium SG8_47]|nr:MAG: 3-mercaptopyruvate sulfurtransferase [Gammaproteobacteria bacterium SG8_47]